MPTTETAIVLIPKSFRHWFDGALKAEMQVYDIEESFGGGRIGTIKIYTPGNHGRTFAVRQNQNNKGRWYISA